MTDKTLVEREAVLRFVECAFRNIDLPPLYGRDMDEIGGALASFRDIILAPYGALAQAAGFDDPLEALKAIPVKDAALKPFAAFDEEIGDGWPDDTLFSSDPLTGREVTFAQVRAARDALANGGTA
jgi:hypothetical protein